MDLAKSADVVWDLNKFPYPFKSNSFDMIYSSHCLEHLKPEMRVRVFKEIHRISRPNGIIHIIVPHLSSVYMSGNLVHTKCFSSVTFKMMEHKKEEIFDYGTLPRFKVERIRLHWYRKPHNLFLRVLDKILSGLANLNITLAEMGCYYVGGFQEIEAVMRPVKD